MNELEGRWVRDFCLAALKPEPGARTPVFKAFEAYQSWLKGMKRSSELSVDGFGRLLPKTVVRKTYFYETNNMRMIVGFEIRA